MNSRLRTARRTVAAVLAIAATLTACQHNVSSEPATPAKDTPAMNLSHLPTLKETQTQMLELLDAVRHEIVQQVPATTPWRWSHDGRRSSAWADSGCTSPTWSPGTR